jgi:hypothetical protein
LHIQLHDLLQTQPGSAEADSTIVIPYAAVAEAVKKAGGQALNKAFDAFVRV